MDFIRNLVFTRENYADTMPFETTMEINECENCKVWMPKEKTPFFKRKKRIVVSGLCKACRRHKSKCVLTKSSYY